MTFQLYKKYLVTTDAWFHAPDGQQYRAVWGTLNDIADAEQKLGLKTNRNSTNWYVTIGNVTIAGCQIHYVVETETCSAKAPTRDIEKDGKLYFQQEAISRIYFADE